jgi:hypothetical protein
MQKVTKIALAVAGAGFILKEYERKKISQPNFYENYTPSKPLSEDQLKMLGGLAFVGGIASAGIIEATKNSPKARKISFIALGGLGVAWFVTILYALNKMS